MPYVHQAADTWSAQPTPLSVYFQTYDDYDWDRAYYFASYDRNWGSSGQAQCWNFDYYDYTMDGNQYYTGYPTCHRGYIQLNVSGSQYAIKNNAYSPPHTILHEMGHVAGLGHSCVKQSIMSGPNSTYGCGTYNPCSANNCITTPQQDDNTGLNEIYNPQSYGGGGGYCGYSRGSQSTGYSSGGATVGVTPHVPRPPVVTRIPSSPVLDPNNLHADTAVPDVTLDSPTNTGAQQIDSVQYTAVWLLTGWATIPLQVKSTTARALGFNIDPVNKRATAC
jgi:hypothetical protein